MHLNPQILRFLSDFSHHKQKIFYPLLLLLLFTNTSLHLDHSDLMMLGNHTKLKICVHLLVLLPASALRSFDLWFAIAKHKSLDKLKISWSIGSSLDNLNWRFILVGSNKNWQRISFLVEMSLSNPAEQSLLSCGTLSYFLFDDLLIPHAIL